MSMLSEDDLNVRELTDEQLDLAWDLWFDLAQATNQWDPAYSHGVFVGLGDVLGHPAERSMSSDATGAGCRYRRR